MARRLPWERLPSEPNLWYQRFEAFRMMGPARTMQRAVNLARAQKGLKESNFIPGSWKAAAKTYRWKKRAEAWDMSMALEAARRAQEERLAVMADGFSLDYKRVEELKALGDKLKEYVDDMDRLWQKEVRQLGSGENAVTVESESFNHELVKQLRGVLADIAEETGGRQKISRNLNINLEDLTDEQLEQIAAGKDPLNVLRSR